MKAAMTRPERATSSAPIMLLLFLNCFAGCASEQDPGPGGTALDVTDETATDANALDAGADGGDAVATTLIAPESRSLCEPPDRTGYTCPAATGDCSDDASCGTDAWCQSTFQVGQASCQCHAIACRSDAECGEDEACDCTGVAMPDSASFADACGYEGSACAPRCVPATCREDAQCGEGGVCTDFRDRCGELVRLACWSPSASTCSPTGGECTRPNERCEPTGDGSWECIVQTTPPCD